MSDDVQFTTNIEETFKSHYGIPGTWRDASSELKAAFTRAMQGCLYGGPALESAWSWFRTGWNAARSAR